MAIGVYFHLLSQSSFSLNIWHFPAFFLSVGGEVEGCGLLRGCWIAQLQEQHSDKGAHPPSIGVSGASWSCAAGAVGALVQADGVWVRVTGSEALKTGVAGKELRGVGSSPQEESSISLKEGRTGKLFFSFSSAWENKALCFPDKSTLS